MPKEEIAKTGSDDKPKTLSRRETLQLMGAALLGITAATYGITTEAGKTPKPESHLDFTPLENDLKPQKFEEVQKQLATLESVINGTVEVDPNKMLSPYYEKIEESIQAVRAIRNAGTLFESLPKEIIAWLKRCNTTNEPVERGGGDWTVESMRYNLQQIVKLEAFRAVKYLETRGLVNANNVGEFHMDGWVNYTPNPDLFLGQNLNTQTSYGKSIKSQMQFYSVEDSRDTLEHTDEIVKTHWNEIKLAADTFDIDPLYIAAIVSMEARDEKTYPIFFSDVPFGDASFGEELMSQQGDSNSVNQLLKVLSFLEEHKDIAKNIVPSTIEESTIDTLGGLIGENTSVGLGQINIETAKRFGLVELFGRRVKKDAPNAQYALLLNNPSVNIMAIAAYTRKMIDEYRRMQESNLNTYLPDLTQYNPSKATSHNQVPSDPIFGENFGIAFFGACYTSKEYPEYGTDDSIGLYIKLRFPPNLENWGGYICTYFDYYNKHKDRLELN